MAVLKSLLSSKKAVVTLASVLCTLIAKCGFDVSQETVTSIIATVGIYVAGQSVADIGKEKEKAKAEAAAK